MGEMDHQIQTIKCSRDKQQGPMYSAGNYIQYSVIHHNRKEYEKKMCITESLVLYGKKLTQ